MKNITKEKLKLIIGTIGNETKKISYHLEKENLINFSITEREVDSVLWNQVEYFCEKIKLSIIIHYDAPRLINDIDIFYRYLTQIENKIDEIEEKIKGE